MKRLKPVTLAAACVVPVVLANLSLLDRPTSSKEPVEVFPNLGAPSEPPAVTLASVLADFAKPGVQPRLDLSPGRDYGPEDDQHKRRLHSLQVLYAPKSCGAAGDQDGLLIYGMVLPPGHGLLKAPTNSRELKTYHAEVEVADLIIQTCGTKFGDDREDMFSPLNETPRFGTRIKPDSEDDHVFRRFLSRIAEALK